MGWSWFRRRRPEPPFSPEWRSILEGVGWWRALRAEERAVLEPRIAKFAREKRWEGCAGLALTDEMRVLVAAEAARLARGLPDDAFWKVETILLYPTTYVVPSPFDGQHGWKRRGTPLLGQASHERGPLVLAWDAARRGSLERGDGDNVILHELAHKLDMLDGWADGTPRLHRSADYARWKTVLEQERKALDEALARGTPTALHAYAATDEAEFFAEATVAFFERPRELRTGNPALYRCLVGYFRQDPAAAAFH